MHAAVGDQHLRPVDDLRKRRLVAANLGVDVPDDVNVATSVSRTFVSTLEKFTPSSSTALPASISCTRRQAPLTLPPGQSVVCTSHTNFGWLPSRTTWQRCCSSSGVYSRERESRAGLDATNVNSRIKGLAAGKWRCAHLARMFLGRTARIVEHLDADVLDNFLSERLRQLRNLNRLIDVAEQIGSEQAVALAAGQRVERVERAGQHSLQVRRQPAQRGEGALLQHVGRRFAGEIAARQMKERGAERARHTGIRKQFVQLAPAALLWL